MAYFADLSPYLYLPRQDAALNVGWLDGAFPFQTGASRDEFVGRLAWLCAHRRVNQTRGFHQCTICAFTEGAHYLQTSQGSLLLGSAEIHVAGDHQVYAAPDLIVHYVVDHSYQPPEEFVRAVEALTDPTSLQQWRVVWRPS